MKHFSPAQRLLICSFAAETFFATYGLVTWSTALITSIGYLVSGLVFFITLLRIPEIRLRLPGPANHRNSRIVKSLLLLLATGLVILTASYWFARIDVDPDFADMLPIIRIMNQRLLSGHGSRVYDIIPELWGGTRPIYLPGMWLPYLPSILAGMDMRWTTAASLLICFGLFIYFLPVVWRRASFWILLGSAAMLFWWLFGRDEQHGVLSLSEEGPVILYYVFLCIALVSDSEPAIGVAVLLCLMSRYSFAGWLPAYGFILLVKRDFKKIFRIALTVAIGITGIFIIPFGLEPVRQMIALPGNYTDFAARVWQDSPETFWVNLGMAKFFGPNRVVLLHHCLVYGSFGLPLIVTAFLLFRKKVVANNLPLAMLKFSLLIFYNLVDVPYGYLFFTCSFVSLMAVVMSMRSAQAFSEAIRP